MEHTINDNPDTREITRLPGAEKITGLSRPTIHRKSRDPDDEFPAAMQLGEHSIGWFLDELIAWRDSRPRIINAA